MESGELYLRRLENTDERPCFDCGDEDLNEFFAKDSKEGTSKLISVTYVFETESGEAACYFCLSNDAIRKEDTSRSRFKKLMSPLPREKRYSSMPAVKIGRLATNKNFQCSGIGTKALDYIKMWFTEGNKTGCRFIIVDAMNNSKTLRFYEKNGFDFLDSHKGEKNNGHTRLMFFDLLTFRP